MSGDKGIASVFLFHGLLFPGFLTEYFNQPAVDISGVILVQLISRVHPKAGITVQLITDQSINGGSQRLVKRRLPENRIDGLGNSIGFILTNRLFPEHLMYIGQVNRVAIEIALTQIRQDFFDGAKTKWSISLRQL